MLRKLAVAIITMAFLAGCTPTQTTAVTDEVKAIATLVADNCDYVVDITSVTAMVTAANPVAVGANAIASAICAALKKKALTPGECPKVNGICVTGHPK